MPTIRMIRLAVGPDSARYPGKTYDVSVAEGTALVGAEAAVWVDVKTKAPLVESAVLPTPETAVGRGQRARGKPQPPEPAPEPAPEST